MSRDISTQQLLLHMGELTRKEIRVAKAAYGLGYQAATKASEDKCIADAVRGAKLQCVEQDCEHGLIVHAGRFAKHQHVLIIPASVLEGEQ